MEITLLEAHGVEQNESLEEEKKDSFDTCNNVLAANSDFHAYCVVSTLFSIARWPSEISQNDMLCTLVIDLLDPSKPNFQLLSATARRIEDSTEKFSEYGLPWKRSILGIGVGSLAQ